LETLSAKSKKTQNIMTTRVKSPIIWGIFIFLLTALSSKSATFSSLYSFSPLVNTNLDGVSTNSDGANLYSSLVVSSNVLYGATCYGGTGGSGTIFRINTDGSCFTNLYNFSPTSNSTNNDGANAMCSLLVCGNTLFGTASAGGSSGAGTVFRINTDGSCFTNLHDFDGSDGASPEGGLVVLSNTLYGATPDSMGAAGTVFAINTDGSDFRTLFDGGGSSKTILLSGNSLYWVGDGANRIFKINTDGTGFDLIYMLFPSGGIEVSDLILVSNRLYGTMNSGGMYSVNIDGTDPTNVFSFGYDDTFYGWPNGAYPVDGVLFHNGALYGTTPQGGTGWSGIIYQVNTDGSCFTNLYNFSGGYDGNWPDGDLVSSGNVLYGATHDGGQNGTGTIFSLNLNNPIQLNAQFNGGAIVFSWENPAFILQASANLSGVYTNIPAATSPYTNFITGSQMYFRLKSN
jgi:uncharacterized repeat protein (TIGR03803 family)